MHMDGTDDNCLHKAAAARIPVAAPGFELADIDGEALLFSHGRTSMHRLNASATLIWKLCDGKRTVAEIVGLISNAFSDKGGDVEGDVCKVIDELIGVGALRWRQE